MYEITQRMIHEVKKVIIGKDELIQKIWIAILAQGHVLLEDVPGVGKTTMALSFAKALGLEVKRVQFTPDTLPSDILGFSVWQDGSLRYQPGAVMTNLLLADEINRTSPKTQSALLEAMEERRVTMDGTTHTLPTPFLVLATQNPIGSAGTQNLPNSQLDRFLLRLSMGYPSRAAQVDILKNRHIGDPLDTVQTVLSKQMLLDAIAQVEQVFVADAVYDYIAALTEATRTHAMVHLGVSPRGAFALCRAAKAAAFTKGRDFVLPEDVQELVVDVFAHRLLLSSKARLNECSAADILQDLLREVPVPQLMERKR